MFNIKHFLTLLLISATFTGLSQANMTDKEIYNSSLGTYEVHINGRYQPAISYDMVKEINLRRKKDEDVSWVFNDKISFVIYSKNKLNSNAFLKKNELIIKYL